jgi:hypothetical protein
MKNLVELQPPGSDRLVVTLLVEMSRDRVSFTPFDNVPLDLDHSSVIESFVSSSLHIGVASLAHIVNCPIAPRTGWLG